MVERTHTLPRTETSLSGDTPPPNRPWSDPDPTSPNKGKNVRPTAGTWTVEPETRRGRGRSEGDVFRHQSVSDGCLNVLTWQRTY